MCEAIVVAELRRCPVVLFYGKAGARLVPSFGVNVDHNPTRKRGISQ
jgi:hypothetical protein